MKLKDFLLPLGIILLTISLIIESITVFTIPISQAYLLSAGSILILLGYKSEKSYAFPVILTLSITNILSHRFNFLQGTEIIGILTVCFLVFYLINFNKYLNLFLILVLSIFIIKYISIFTYQGNGFLLTSDDHASFFYRIRLLLRHFPDVPFYNPTWNAGWDQRDFFATGSLSLFFISLPFHLIFSPTTAYNFSIIFILVVLSPLAMFSACRILGYSFRASVISAILAITNGLVWYRWGLKFGTMGFVISCTLLPLVIALSVKLAKKELNLFSGILYIIVSTLMLFWTPSSIVLLPIAIYLICTIHKWISIKNILICLTIIAINVPVILMLFNVSKIGNFVSDNKNQLVFDNLMNVEKVSYKHTDSNLSVDNIFKPLKETFVSCNPLIWLLIIPALLTRNLASRGIFIATSVWLLFLGTFAIAWKPQLEFDRMLVFLIYVSSIPVGYLLSKENSRLSISALCSLLFCSLLSTASIFNNRSWDKYTFETSKDQILVTELKKLNPTGRILFSGFVQHNYGDGHLALLPDLVDVQVIANSPYHNLWTYTQIFPNQVLEQDEFGISNYLYDLNVEYVFAHETFWIQKFRNYKWLEEINSSSNFKIFRIKNFKSNYFATGQGTINKISEDKVEFNLISDEVVMKFRYFKFLKVKGCQIKPEAKPGLGLIRISNCSEKNNLILESVSPSERLLNG